MSPDDEGAAPRGGRPPLHARHGAVVDGHDRRGELDRLRRRLRAGDGVRLPHRGRVGHLRPAGDQPRDHPGLRRHAAPAAARGRGEGARDEPHRRPDRRLRGAPGRARQPGGAGPRAVRHGAGVGAQARPSRRRSRSRRSRSARRSRISTRDSQRGRGLRARLRVRGREGGHLRVPHEAPAQVQGQ